MNKGRKPPYVSLAALLLIIFACLFADMLAPYDPAQMDASAAGKGPCAAHLLGTDPMGRDLLSMLLFGGRSSLYIGFLSGILSASAAVIYGTVSGLCSERISDLMMRFSELLMSIPSVLLVIFLQAVWGNPTVTSLSVIIGLTGWMNMAKIVRSEVRQIGRSDYVLAAKIMEGGFWYILGRHLLPGFVSSIMFMAVTGVGQAIITESTLSFLGLGLPLTEVSWGSLMSMSEEALLSGNWWMIVIPGLVLITTLVCITAAGEYVRKRNNRLYSNL